jgi:phage/plasmid-like protein (TIGR03299 family)
MSHELEQVTINGEEIATFAFSGVRTDIWHRLGQQFENDGLMTAEEAMSRANMDRQVTTVPAVLPVDEWGDPLFVADGLDMPHFVVLDGKPIITPSGDLGQIPTKIVGVTGKQGSVGHADLSILDRFQYAEEAIRASRGEAVWSTAGLLRDGRQGFATMEAPPTIVDPDGINDIIRKYLTVTWSFDGSRSTELGISDVRVVCANTLWCHDRDNKVSAIKIKHTSRAEDRFRLAAQHWALAQDSSAALKLQAERMLAVGNGKQMLRRVCDEVLGLKPDADASQRANSIAERKRDELYVLYHAKTNSESVGDNGWAVYNTVTEYFDWFSDVKGKDKELTRLRNQFDGAHNNIKQTVADFILQDA